MFRLQVDGFVIEMDTAEEVAQLLANLGVEGKRSSPELELGAVPKSRARSEQALNALGPSGVLGPLNGRAERDPVLLQEFLSADHVGVPSAKIQELLGVTGRGIVPALMEWWARLYEPEEPKRLFQSTRSNSHRGFRLTEFARNRALGVRDQEEDGQPPDPK